MRYYLPLVRRGVPEGARALAEYDEPTFIRSIGKTVHGWAEYDRELTDREIEDYELVPERK